MKRCLLFVSRKEGHIGACTVQGVKNLDRRFGRRDAMMYKTPAVGIGDIYESGDGHRVQGGWRGRLNGRCEEQ